VSCPHVRRASGTTSYTWAARNQLAAISGPAGSASFKYDALGRRIEKTVNGVTTGFFYDGAQAIAELKGNALDTVYHTGLAVDEVLARYAPSGNKTLLTDALQSVIAQANDSQSADNFYAYSPYGEATTLGPDERNPLQYTGRENDGTGLYYYRARYYDPVLKRFINEDPIGVAGGLNLYAYVRGNPISRIDPLGLTDIIFDASGGRIHVIDQYGESAGNFPASNNPVSTSLGEFPAGTYSFSWWNPHQGAGENSSFGSNGNFIFDVPNRQGMGVHSGRANSCSANRCGYNYPTDGCIRTTDHATEAMRRLHRGGDPVRGITVLR